MLDVTLFNPFINGLSDGAKFVDDGEERSGHSRVNLANDHKVSKETDESVIWGEADWAKTARPR